MNKKSLMTIVHDWKKGFTLIELLVVIAIIALLLSIILPSLKKAKEYAQRMVCASQFRQIALIQNNYASDFGSWIPRYTDSSNIDKPNYEENVRARPGVMLAESLEYCRSAYGIDDNIWVCPSFYGHNEDAISWEEEGAYLMRSGDVAWDGSQWPPAYWTMGSVSLVGLTADVNVRPRSGFKESAKRITDPGYYVLAADVNFRSQRDWQFTGTAGGAPSSRIAHKGKNGLPAGANVAHVDLSVTWTKPVELAYDRRTLKNAKPSIISIDHEDAAGKYDGWAQDGREYFW